MGRTPDLGQQAEALRALAREANGTIKDLHTAEKTLRNAIDEARRTGPAIVEEYLRGTVAERLAAVGATLTALADTAARRAEAVHAEPGRLHDTAARLAATPADSPDGPGAFSCPNCGTHLDAHKDMGSIAEPVGGADADGFTVCAYCGQVIILTSGGETRSPTGAEDAAVRRTAMDIGPGGLGKIRDLVERGSLGTPGAKALSKQIETGRPAQEGPTA